MPSLADLKKNRESQMNKLKEATTNTRAKDERFWSPTFDKEKGKGSAVVRFLPAPPGEDLAMVRTFSHNFKGPSGRYYSEMSLTTIGKPDPCMEMLGRLWNSGIESDKDVRKTMARKTNYYTNVLVVKDPANPANEGKVFLYRFGPQIHEMVNEALFPEDNEVEPLMVFDPWDGANFEIVIKGKTMPNKDVVPDYTRSRFMDPTPISDDDDDIDEIWKKTHSLADFTSVDKFKSYEDLQKKLYEVLGATVGSGVEVVEGWTRPVNSTPAPAPRSEPEPRAERTARRTPNFDEDDEDMQAPMATPAPKVSSIDDDDDDEEFLRSIKRKK